MSASTSADNKVSSLFEKYALKHAYEDIQDDMMKYLLSLEEDALIEVLSNRKSIRRYKDVLPMMAYLFNNCKSEKVCKWLTENTSIEDDGIIEEYLEEEEPEEWKVKLANKWLDTYDRETDD